MNEVYHLSGGRPLRGHVKVQGAKNSVLPILAATIVTGGERVIHNCPKLSDVDASIAILRHLGCRVEREGHTVWVDSRPMDRWDIPDTLMREMRSSVMFMGAVAARCGQVEMTYPGGCELGARPIDLHLNALRSLGAEVHEENGSIRCQAGPLRGGEIALRFPSVGATENILLAASRASGRIVIRNAAREPEICDLAAFLRRCGMDISGDGTGTIEVEGRCGEETVSHTVIPDRIAAATYLACAAACGGDVTVENAAPEQLQTVCDVFERAGCALERGEKAVRLRAEGRLKSPGLIETEPYPGFPTDAQAPVMAALLKCGGETEFRENIFENRFRHVWELRRLGADIVVRGRTAHIRGVEALHGASMTATDLRGGAALVAAALSAEGESVIGGLGHMDRGYEDLEGALQKLGADIRRG